MENKHLMKENKSNEIKLVQISEEFNKFVFNLNQSNIELEETKRNLDMAKATMIKNNSELNATNAELNCKIEQLHKKEEELSSTKEDLAINKNKLSTAHKNIACTREELIQGKIDFNILKHDYETTMEALKSTKVDLKNANDELTSSKVELIKTKNAFSAKFDNILAKAEDLSIKKEVLEINHKYCDTNLRDQIDQTECLKVESKEKNKIIESFKVSEDKSNGKILDLESIIIAKDIKVDKLDMNIKYIEKDLVESMTNIQKQIAEQEKAKNRIVLLEKENTFAKNEIKALQLKGRQKDHTIVELLDSDETLNNEKENLEKKIKQLHVDLQWQTDKALGFVIANKGLTNELANKVKVLEEERDLAKSFMISLVKINPFGQTEVAYSDMELFPKSDEEGEEEPTSDPDIPTTSFMRTAI